MAGYVIVFLVIGAEVCYNLYCKLRIKEIIMELSSIVFVQVMIVFVLLALGYVLSKSGMVKDSGLKQITDILLYVVTPCLLVNAYQKDFSKELISGLVIGFGFAIIIHLVGIVISTIIFRKEDSKRYRVSIFSSVYSNCGYMAIPLLSAALGSDGVFYGSAYLTVFTILYWTHGICVYRGDFKELSFKKIIKNPGIIGVSVALIMFVSRIKLPYVLGEALGHLAGLNTPLAMIVMGSYLAKTDFKKALSSVGVYMVSALRLLVIPVICVFLARLLPIPEVVARALLISSACPVAAVGTLLAGKYDLDASYSAETVAVSTLLSIITIPIVLMLYQL